MGIGFAEDLLVCVALGVDMVRFRWAYDLRIIH